MARTLDGKIQFWAAGCERIYGWSADEAVGRDVHELLQTTFPIPFADIESALLSEEVWEGDLRQVRRDGTEVIVSARKALRRDASGRPVAVAESLTDVTALRRAQALSRDLMATIDLAAVMARSLDGTIQFWSVGCERIYGWPQSEAIGKRAHDLLRTSFPIPQKEIECILMRDGEWRGDLRQCRYDGAEIIVSAHKAIRMDEHGRPVAVAESLTDVTALRIAEERQAMLAREVDHRAKNVLAVALSIVRLTPRDSVDGFADAVEGRVAAMARAHTVLAADGWSGAALQTLAESELAAHAHRVVIAGPAVRLKADAVQPMAMILHELATNAAKYGALASREGRVVVSWYLANDGVLHFQWQEIGGRAMTTAPTRQGFGTQLLASVAQGQLQGNAEFSWLPSGLLFSLTVHEDLIDKTRPYSALERSSTDPATPPVIRAPVHPPAPQRSGRILVVEDEILLALEIEQSVHSLGYEVAGPAGRLDQAIHLASFESDIAAAVIDINLAGELSFPVADLLQTRGIPYVIATGYGGSPSLQRRDHGAVAVLHKPFPRAALVAALRSALENAPSDMRI